MRENVVLAFLAFLFGCLAATVVVDQSNQIDALNRKLTRVTEERDVLRAVQPTVITLPCPEAKPARRQAPRKRVVPVFEPND